MKAICVAAKREWNAVLSYYSIKIEDCQKYPFGEYFIHNSILFFRCGVRKTNSSAATQYIIDHFNLNNLICIGTCAGIDLNYSINDIFIPNQAVQWDCTLSNESLFKETFIIPIDISNLNFQFKTGTIATGDKAIVTYEYWSLLNSHHTTIADCECGAIAYICKMNHVPFLAIKGITDFPEINLSPKESDKKQTQQFINHTPNIIHTILNEYVPKILITKQ